jgi:hypothetical protein
MLFGIVSLQHPFGKCIIENRWTKKSENVRYKDFGTLSLFNKIYEKFHQHNHCSPG